MTVLYAVGDGATGGVDAARVAAMIADAKPDGFLWLGDVYEQGAAAEFAANYQPSWGQLDPICFPVPGNHDKPSYASGFLPYFSRQPHLSYLSAEQSWTAVGFGDWLVFLLDSEAPSGPGSPQYEWASAMLQPADLVGNARRRIACWHRPRYCSGSHGDADDLDPLWRLVAPHCAAVLSGHAHNMQQFKPDDEAGCRQLVSGAGGRALYAEIPGDPRLEWGSASGYGAVRLELGAALGVRWVDENGAALYESTVVL